jgi:hypothetical protein
VKGRIRWTLWAGSRPDLYNRKDGAMSNNVYSMNSEPVNTVYEKETQNYCLAEAMLDPEPFYPPNKGCGDLLKESS